MADKQKTKYFRWIRRLVQLFFLFLFFYLIYKTIVPFDINATRVANRPHLPVELFFFIDPLISLITLLSSWHIYRWLVLSLITVILTIILGRVFCGWICPFGTINHIIGLFRSKLSMKKQVDVQKPSKYMKIKYIILAVIVGISIAGSAFGSILDPFSLLTKGISLIFFPIIGQSLHSMNQSDNGYIQAGYYFISDVFTGFKPYYTNHSFWIGILFFIIILLNIFVPRLWCRFLCPLGAMLSIIGKFNLFKIKRDEDKCTHCLKCVPKCQGACSPDENWIKNECLTCLNCVVSCPENALSTKLCFTKFENETLEKENKNKPQVKRRDFIVGTIAGFSLIPIVRTDGITKKLFPPDLIRPPGSLKEGRFLSKCIRCGLCMKICPNNALHPSWGESGVESIWTPVLVPRIGYCDPSCTLCSQICPTGAISPITSQEKRRIKIGTAIIDHNQCLPWALDIPCIVCEEFCPTSPKAIHTQRIEKVNDNGQTIVLQLPRVDPTKCTGCGACEHVCPVHTKPAIKVISIGESRESDNQFLLNQDETND